ncbi:Adhesion G protein-coupled receptor A3 [Characodon lateralis]|uniref:Adhesion G protein-coupled receptor A3 n=1 Tax=Characodon lateralis TaxID=208331 RepID=A0ABU7F6J9_9TELE|nr:Adhesion G protein-coupled receptor A3 [Characodon lateralis]
MRLDWLQLVVVLLLSGLRGSAVPFACKTSDERPRSGGKSPVSDRKVVCSNMDLHQVLPPDSFPNRTVTLSVSDMLLVHTSGTSPCVVKWFCSVYIGKPQS